MRDLLWVTRKDLLRRARDPLSLLLWISIPLAVAILMKLAFGGGGSGRELPRAKLAISDQDSTMVTRLLKASFGQGGLSRLIEPLEEDSARAITLAREGKVSAALLIPKGFTDDFLDNRTARLALYKNPQQRILPGIIEEVLSTLADGGFYVRELFAEPIGQIRTLVQDAEAGSKVSTPPSGIQTTFNPADSTVAALSTAINQEMRHVGKYLLPPVISLKMENGKETGLSGDYFFLLFPGMVLMSLLFVSQALADDLWAEHKRGTFRRQQISPGGGRSLIPGKTLAGTIILFLVVSLLLVIGRTLFRLELHGILAASLFCAAAAFGILSVIHFVVLLPRTENGANILTSLFVMPLVLIGGGFFPIETMAPFLQRIARHTPNGWMLGYLKEILAGRGRLAESLLAALICVAVGLLFLPLAQRQARRRFLGA